jgi:hypothetical protein
VTTIGIKKGKVIKFTKMIKKEGKRCHKAKRYKRKNSKDVLNYQLC